MPGEYKTEEQLKQEAKLRMELEAKAAKLKPKTELQKKRENFWYHYKWHTISAVFILFLAVFFTKDIIFSTKPDLTVIVVAGEYLGQESIDELKAALEARSGDFNGDGKVSVLVDFIPLPTEDNGQDYAQNMKLVTVMAAAADPIYLLDKESFDSISSMAGEGPVFEEISVPADALSLDGEEFKSLALYIRKQNAFAKNPDYYSYCLSLLLSL